MKLRGFAVAAAVLLTAGCIRGERTIKLEADGSATIVDQVKMVGAFAEMMQGLKSMADEGEAPVSAEEMEAKAKENLKEAMASMGPGVTLVSLEKAEDGTETITYAVEDITKIKLNAMPENSFMASSSSGDDNGPSPLQFSLTSRGDNTVLTITNPLGAEMAEAEEKDEAAEPPTEEEAAEAEAKLQQEMEQTKQMFAGASISVRLEVDGKVVKTNAPESEGSVVTVFAFDFDKLFADEKGLRLFAGAQSGPPDPEQLKEMPGVAISPEPEIVVEFSGT